MREHAQEMDADVLQAHVRTFVNPVSLDMGVEGRQALEALETMALNTGIL